VFYSLEVIEARAWVFYSLEA